MYLHLIILFLIVIISSVLITLNNKPVIIEEFIGESIVRGLLADLKAVIMAPVNGVINTVKGIENFVNWYRQYYKIDLL